MKRAALVLLALPTLPLYAGNKHFDVEASFVPAAKPGADAVVAVRFTAIDPAVRLNAEPAPRLRLDPAQGVLVEKAAPAHSAEPPAEPGTPRYLDLGSPVRFPVAIAAGAAKGSQAAKGSVTYFYCSKREGWCRKGTAELEIPVLVR